MSELEDHKDIVGQIEMHDIEGIRHCFSNGLDPNSLFNGEPLIYELTSEYLRGSRFKECVKLFVEYGLEFEDKALLSVLLDDDLQLKTILQKHPDIANNSYTMRCSYTPLEKVSLLHICAEFNHLNCAKVLVDHGVDVNSKAGFDEHGFGGQTPIFHTVNQNMNQSYDMLEFLLSKNADLQITVKGLVWGKTYEWETLIPAVNPISYAMMGLLPQMHRDEKTITDVVSKLLKHEFVIDYKSGNIPNKYLSN